MGLSRRFGPALRTLSRRSSDHASADRDPASITELGASRILLEDARTDMDAVRKADGIEPRRERTSPKYVDPEQGTKSASKFEIAAVLVSVIILIAGVVLVLGAVRTAFEETVDLEVVRGSANIAVADIGGGECEWTLSYTLRSEEVDVVVGAISVPRWQFEAEEGEFPATVSGERSSRLVHRADCDLSPPDPADLELVITYRTPVRPSTTSKFSLDG